MADAAEGNGVKDRVDAFIQHFQDLDVIAKPLHETDRQLAHELSQMLSDYLAMDPRSPYRDGMASLCEVYINRAIGAGVIKEGEGLLRHLKKQTEEREKLMQENEKLQAEIKRLEAELAFLRKGPALTSSPLGT